MICESHDHMEHLNTYAVHSCILPHSTQGLLCVCVCVPYGFRKDCTGQFEKTLHRITRWEKTFQIIRSTSNQGRKSPVGLELWKLLDPPKIRHRKNTVRSWTLYFFPLLIKKITHIFACAAKNSGHRKLWHSSKKNQLSSQFTSVWFPLLEPRFFFGP